ncbi:hypothetical protein PC129_g24331 [Phytophthora cactorum]|uniref:Uncharacterized protein n=1 Tax=Phytophthora cactorum TaxID=29920 RepID=A0A8T0Y5A9_9STRA|nr:hypothetical protein PC112_g24658 [Phytophthora cactorum]KAG2803514.1 hypothetical protein PC113_g24390 [Phytophthora cactorum]KAG2872033.1 hypothetical protein PC115_g24707 [Phytophthora cactorum]KAG2875872.1 hypothetical protein PC117_g27355 [Phytophthora cactorum]KAG2957179.1 hypothetical protein PC119_g27412 [Phytophthora cactorum]
MLLLLLGAATTHAAKNLLFLEAAVTHAVKPVCRMRTETGCGLTMRQIIVAFNIKLIYGSEMAS